MRINSNYQTPLRPLNVDGFTLWSLVGKVLGVFIPAPNGARSPWSLLVDRWAHTKPQIIEKHRTMIKFFVSIPCIWTGSLVKRWRLSTDHGSSNVSFQTVIITTRCVNVRVWVNGKKSNGLKFKPTTVFKHLVELEMRLGV